MDEKMPTIDLYWTGYILSLGIMLAKVDFEQDPVYVGLYIIFSLAVSLFSWFNVGLLIGNAI